MNNLELDMTYYKGANPNAWLGVALRADPTDSWVNSSSVSPNAVLPSNGYVLRIRFGGSNSTVLRKVEDNLSTDLVSGFDANSRDVNIEARVRMQVDGTTVRFKEWKTSETEPASWTSVTDSTFSEAGSVRIGFASGSTDTPPFEWFVRDLKVTDLDTATVVFDADFSGTNGDPWPSAQFTNLNRRLSDDVVDVQSGEGRIQLNNINSWARAFLTLDEAETGVAVPSGFTFTASGLQLDGSWSAVSGADSYDWEIERDDAGSWVAFDSGNTAGTSFQVTTGVEYGTTYRARVRTDDGGVKSDWTAYTSASTPADAFAISGQQIEAVALSWTAADGPYDIRRDETTLIAEGLTVTTFTDDDVTAGTSYTYEVREDGGAWSAPTTVAVVAGGGGVFFLKPNGGGWST